MKVLATLDLRRHFYKSPDKDGQGRTRIDPNKSHELAERVAAAALPQRTTHLFHGVEPRTEDTLTMIETVWGQTTTRFLIDEIGGDAWTLRYAFTKELQAELKATGRKDYLRFLIEKLGRTRIIQMALYAMSGIYKMFWIMPRERASCHGLAIGHSPDMLMFIPWALAGFPEDVSVLDHGGGNLPEGEGYRVALMEDGTLQLLEHLSL